MRQRNPFRWDSLLSRRQSGRRNQQTPRRRKESTFQASLLWLLFGADIGDDSDSENDGSEDPK